MFQKYRVINGLPLICSRVTLRYMFTRTVTIVCYVVSRVCYLELSVFVMFKYGVRLTLVQHSWVIQRQVYAT